jgi:L-ascorbate metabolism protein UlaG (beta-lactamase superfamily)
MRYLKVLVVCAVVVGAIALPPRAWAQNLSQEPACQTLTTASAGGPMPKGQNVVVVRWLGHTNYELAYRDSVILLDAYYDRGPRTHPIGVTAKEFKRADAILIGHAHSDHMSDAASVAQQTGATVVGAVFGSDVVRKAGLPEKQIRTVAGGEKLQFKSVAVQTALGHHNVIATTVPEGYLEKMQQTIAEASLQEPFTPAEQAQLDAIRERGSRDPKIATEGVISYLLTFGNNFRVIFANSPGPVTDGQRKLMEQVPAVDVAMLPLVNMDAGIPPMVELAKLFKPGTVMLGHHDGRGTMGWTASFLAANALRQALPKSRTLDVLYRTPVCFNTATKEMFVGN